MDTSILDRLGEYRPAKKAFVIYDVMCQQVGPALDLDVAIVKQIVETHETFRAVTHLGKDTEGRVRENFALAETEDKELFD